MAKTTPLRVPMAYKTVGKSKGADAKLVCYPLGNHCAQTMRNFSLFLAGAIFALGANALDNGLAITPQMGWVNIESSN